MSRLKSEIWVQALLRTNLTKGRFGAIIHKGAEEAGAVYIYINHEPMDWASISAIVERRRKYDNDLWAVEIEDRLGLGGIIPEKKFH
jgi:hypothetical protein